MIEVAIDVETDCRRLHDIICWVVSSGSMRGRIGYRRTPCTGLFQFSDAVDAVYFKLAWIGN